jgi:hypothetical protein
MSWRKMLLAAASVAVVAIALVPTDASARSRTRAAMTPDQYDRLCGRLPGFGFDGCGLPEFSYGAGSCWARVIVATPDGPQPRRVSICG